MSVTGDSAEPRVDAALVGVTGRYEVVPCDPDLADTVAFCEAYGYAAEDSANAIVVVGKGDPLRYACCVLLATTRLDVNGVVRRRLGTRKASFADAEATLGLTRMTLGGVTPVGLPGDLPLWVDAAVMERERVIVGGGSRARKLLVPPALLLEVRPDTEVVDGLASPR